MRVAVGQKLDRKFLKMGVAGKSEYIKLFAGIWLRRGAKKWGSDQR